MVTSLDFVNRLKVRTALHVSIIDSGSERVPGGGEGGGTPR